ncbi:hypothetical protein DFJ63DRAFT_105095 [Scheffersomyces coipomensis]|uniref:uncharacterized protein n=1 Tax=Scheffersomyces coipomensis TaxID=1788519 RepID=UPI00315CC7B9
MFTHNNINLALFEIKLKSPHKNLVLLKGNEFEVENVPFEGNVKLSIPEDIHIKKITLNLIGEFNVQYFRRGEYGSIIDQVYERFCVLDVKWNNLLTSPDGEILFGNYGDDVLPYSQLSSLESKSKQKLKSKSKSTSPDRPTYLRTNSHPNISQMNKTNGSNSSISTSGPNNASSTSLLKVPKSGIDGTPFENLTFNPQHSFLLPKGNYNLPFKIYLPTNICETVEGIACGKMQYKMLCTISRGKFEKPISTSKYIRILRTLNPMNLNLIDSIDIANVWPNKLQYLVSLTKKGVAIGSTIPINIIIVPLVKGLRLKAINACIVEHFHVTHETSKSPEYELLVGKQTLKVSNQDELGDDKWVIKSLFKVPHSLNTLAQSCELKNNYIDIKHRIRVSIQLKNKEGHISELRANLPICVYVSAHAGHVVANHNTIEEYDSFIQQDKQVEDILFKKDRDWERSNNSGPPSNSDTPNISEAEEEDDDNDLDRENEAPPLYQQHVFDRVYDMNLPQTPLEQFRSQENTPDHSTNNSTTNLTSYFDDYFPIPSSGDQKAQTPPHPLDVVSLCRIPTYEQALSDDEDEELVSPAPEYTDDESYEGDDNEDEGNTISHNDLLYMKLAKLKANSPSNSNARPIMPKLKSMDRNQFRLGARQAGIKSMPHSPLARSPIRGHVDIMSSIDDCDGDKENNKHNNDDYDDDSINTPSNSSSSSSHHHSIFRIPIPRRH